MVVLKHVKMSDAFCADTAPTLCVRALRRNVNEAGLGLVADLSVNGLAI